MKKKIIVENIKIDSLGIKNIDNLFKFNEEEVIKYDFRYR